MFVSVIVPPVRPLSVDAVKLHCRIEGGDEDAYVEALIDAATAWLGGPGGWLGVAIGQQTLELTASAFCTAADGLLPLPYWPVSAPVTVQYLDGSGVLQTLPAEQYEVSERGIRRVAGDDWPGVAGRADAVRIRYVAGSAEVPAPILHAMKLLIAHWYREREPINVGNITSALPFSIEALLSTVRRWP